MSITITLPEFTITAHLGDTRQVTTPGALTDLLLAVACAVVPELGIALNVVKLAQLLAAGVASAVQQE